VTKIHLTNGEDILVGVPLSEMVEKFKKALASDQLLELHDPHNGGSFAINPSLVLYLREDADTYAPAEASRGRVPTSDLTAARR
jgi:hypothetical protein